MKDLNNSKQREMQQEMINTVKNLIDELGKLDPDSKEYQDLTEEIQLLQNDLIIEEIMGDD